MNYIYTNTRDNRSYVLNPEVTMGAKLCLVDMSTCEDKFVSVSTLKRWYTKTQTEDTVVEVRAFTDMIIGLYRVSNNRPGDILVWTKKGALLSFDAKTKKQTNAKNPKFANHIGRDYQYPQSSLTWALS